MEHQIQNALKNGDINCTHVIKSIIQQMIYFHLQMT